MRGIGSIAESRRLAKALAICICAGLGMALTTGCAGYRLGPTSHLPAGSRSIEVRAFKNETFEPRLSEAVALALRRQIQQDGTFELATDGGADIVVEGVLTDYDRSALSFDPSDVVRARDFRISVSAAVTAVDRISGAERLKQSVSGRTTVRALADFTSAERQGVPLLAEDLARNITSLLVDGSW